MAKKIVKDEEATKGKTTKIVPVDAKRLDAKSVSLSDMPKLKVTPGKPVTILVNFKEVEQFLDLLIERYETMEFTTANLEEVQKAKAAMRALRVEAEKFEKDTKSSYFNNPKKLFEIGMSPVFSKIASIETKCDDVLAKEDQKRIDGINLALDHYIEVFIKEYELSEEYRTFDKKKAFYNKGQGETDTIADLRAQAEVLAKAQKAFESGERLIRKACKDEPMLNVTRYIEQLASGEDVANILEDIDAEIERINSVKEVEAEKVVVGSPVTAFSEAVPASDGEEEITDIADELDLESDLPERTKTLILEITYPVDLGNELTELFAKLFERGIKSKVLEVK